MLFLHLYSILVSPACKVLQSRPRINPLPTTTRTQAILLTLQTPQLCTLALLTSLVDPDWL